MPHKLRWQKPESIGLNVLSYKFGSKDKERAMFTNALINIAEQKLLSAHSRGLVRDKNNQTIGSNGITGDLSGEDEPCAVAGIKTTELVADTRKNQISLSNSIS